jgi:hypothetical protein
LLFPSPSATQQTDPPVKTEYCRSKTFNIPFNASDSRVARIHLYRSEDQGHTWIYYGTAVPAQGHKWFEVKVDRDGWYWYSVQAEDANRQLYPARMDAQTPPSLKVCVDEVPPRVTLQQISAPAGQVGVSWVVQDQNLSTLNQNKAARIVLEYRVANRDLNWTPVTVEQSASGRATWDPATNGPIEARLRATDDAGNTGEFTANVTPGGGTDPTPARPATAQRRRFTNRENINLKFNLQDVGKSGVSLVEVWYTTDSRSWTLKKSWSELPKELDKPLAIPVQFQNEGLYGFTLIPRSGVGRGAAGPQVGDDAQIWIEYDKTSPVVRLISVDVGRGEDDGKLLIAWSVEDRNIDRGERCVTLSYAEDPKGPWTPFATQVPNDGFFTWKMDGKVPFQFYVRVEARDKAGNVGKADSPERIKVDLNLPRANVSGIDPDN